MKKLILLYVAVFACSALAAPLATEPFAYSPGSVVGENGGTGWGGSWIQPATAGTQEVVAEGLSFSNFPSSGGALKLVDTDPAWSSIGVARPLGFDFPIGYDLWVSFLARIDSVEPATSSRTAELRHGPTSNLNTVKLRMRPKGVDSQGVMIAYDDAASNSASQNAQDARTYLFICRYGDIGTDSGKYAVMWCFEEAGYDVMMADGVAQEDELNVNSYLTAQDPHANRTLDSTDSAYILLANSKGDTFGYYFDELRYGLSLQDVIPDPNKARDPSPFSGEEGVLTNETLTWTAANGIDANGNQVYFGTDETAVETATPGNPMGVYQGAQSSTSLTVALERGTRYFWRVDSVVGGIVQKGYVWDFWTFQSLSIEDFESYSSNTTLKNVWDDYVENDSGATIELSSDPVYEGSQALKYLYESQYGDSIASIEYAQAQDWSVNDSLLVMDVWFRGTAANTTQENMFITIEDSTGSDTVTYPDSSDLQNEEWMVWHIDMSEFDAVDLADVRKFTIGFTEGAASGAGFVYFDDIAIYACRPGGLQADLDGDCEVGMSDFAILAGEWLQKQLY